MELNAFYLSQSCFWSPQRCRSLWCRAGKKIDVSIRFRALLLPPGPDFVGAEMSGNDSLKRKSRRKSTAIPARTLEPGWFDPAQRVEIIVKIDQYPVFCHLVCVAPWGSWTWSQFWCRIKDYVKVIGMRCVGKRLLLLSRGGGQMMALLLGGYWFMVVQRG